MRRLDGSVEVTCCPGSVVSGRQALFSHDDRQLLCLANGGVDIYESMTLIREGRISPRTAVAVNFAQADGVVATVLCNDELQFWSPS
ncbi:MAG: hypothetical protein ACYCOU_01475 [Sulfobacillus sp.]